MSTATRNPAPSADPDETRPIRELIDEVVPEPAAWLDSPNAHMGGGTPREMIDTGRESFVRDLVRAIKHGMFS